MPRAPIALALCHGNATGDYERWGRYPIALAQDAQGEVPEWIQLLPAPDENGRVATKDGRFWTIDTSTFLAATRVPAHGLIVDYEHATQRIAKEGHEAPAAGWISALEVREGAIWGKVDWTPRGRASIESHEYRLISPTFRYDWRDGRALSLQGAALTNDPAFDDIPAMANTEETLMNEEQLKQLRSTLNLPADADGNAVLAAASALSTGQPGGPANAGTGNGSGSGADPDPSGGAPASATDLVPRADYDHAMRQASEARQALAQRENQDRETEISSAVDEAIAAGKIAPESKDYHLAACRAEGGLAKFREWTGSAPTIGEPVAAASAQGTGLGSRTAGLTQEDILIGAKFGLTPEQLRSEGKAQPGAGGAA